MASAYYGSIGGRIISVTFKVTGIVTGLAPGAVIVMVPVYVPISRPDGSTDTVSVEGAVPETGLTSNQEALLLALQVSVPPPPLSMLTVFAGGTDPLRERNTRLVGLTVITGVLLMVRVIGILSGELEAPAAVIVTVPVCVPTASPALFIDTVSVEGAVPEVGLTVIHVLLSVAVQLSVPTPVLVMEMVLGEGFGPAGPVVKLRLVGLTPITGVATFSVTVTVLGELLAPGEVTVIAPV